MRSPLPVVLLLLVPEELVAGLLEGGEVALEVQELLRVDVDDVRGHAVEERPVVAHLEEQRCSRCLRVFAMLSVVFQVVYGIGSGVLGSVSGV